MGRVYSYLIKFEFPLQANVFLLYIRIQIPESTTLEYFWYYGGLYTARPTVCAVAPNYSSVRVQLSTLIQGTPTCGSHSGTA